MPWTTAAPTTIHRAEVTLAPERERQTTATPAMATLLPASLATVSRSPSASAAIATLTERGGRHHDARGPRRDVKLAGVQEHLIRRHAEERGGSEEQRVPALGRRTCANGAIARSASAAMASRMNDRPMTPRIGGGHPDRRERARPHHDDSETRGQHLERLHARQNARPIVWSIESFRGERKVR
jgi:hypothetical protein